MQMTYNEKLIFIRCAITKPALMEQAAEEASELAQAFQKCARILRGENPSRQTFPEAYAHLIEEISDVENCKALLKIYGDPEIKQKKMDRWVKHVIKERKD